jgi:hypothetical protein
MNHAAIKALARGILQRAESFDWTLQGLGMLRTYLSKEVRLHVWDDRYAVRGVSTMHTHPWDFESLVVAGVLINKRYRVGDHGLPYNAQELRCGPGGCLKSSPYLVYLNQAPGVEAYTDGELYTQRADEIHVTKPQRGTVTLIHRRFHEDEDTARVYWPRGSRWVSAEPRPATPEEIQEITSHALSTWFR